MIETQNETETENITELSGESESENLSEKDTSTLSFAELMMLRAKKTHYGEDASLRDARPAGLLQDAPSGLQDALPAEELRDTPAGLRDERSAPYGEEVREEEEEREQEQEIELEQEPEQEQELEQEQEQELEDERRSYEYLYKLQNGGLAPLGGADKREKQRNIIDRFIQSEPKITPGKAAEYTAAANVGKDSLEEDFSFATETMAKLFVQQGKLDKARKVYRKLMQLHPEKSVYFATQLKNLNQFKK
jgi:hypothetical protein